MRSAQVFIVALAVRKVTEGKMLKSVTGELAGDPTSAGASLKLLPLDTGYYGEPDGDSCPGPQGQQPFSFVWDSSRQGAICSVYGRPRTDCPPAPEGTTAKVQSNGLWCLLTCGEGNACPDRMYCETLFYEFPICLFEKQGLPDNYGKPTSGQHPACPNQQQSYGLSDSDGSRYATCAPYDCQDDTQCPPPQPAITAPATCKSGYCFLGCDKVGCPEGMDCVNGPGAVVCAFRDGPPLRPHP
ncbi:hypothetical protein FOL47_007327 [Perkinsus chesapeaki]|uniref:Uncharacterized protein n=1 Tax=Perkinsus chesapeaki TaxID=330153 RepID=A0A7J6MWB6_PERCH|nr:hypothetical protein FOL47_007327 [Perkinsus chesapeaki]